ncbi:MAG: N-acyl homoserine lactonase family protein [Solirubrobacterales bacterium]|nr:N-acyl homoserine lactonase family protein [Solirubrobacterales bacterium]
MYAEVRGESGDIRITAISTGTANCHKLQEAGRDGASPMRRKLDIMRDREWTGPKPIYTFLIEHPEGLFLVDTGDNHHNSEQKGYLPWWNPFFQKAVQIKVAPEEEIGPQLTRLGVNPGRDLKAVLMTHLHHDHTGGLGHFPHTPIMVADENVKAAKSKGSLAGALKSSFPRWFDPTPIEFTGESIGQFTRSAPITKDGSIVAVEIPGHMEGQVAYLVRAGDVTYVLAGDLTYTQEFLLADVVDGVTADPDLSLASQRKVKALAAEEPIVLLPAHDPGIERRLPANEVVPSAVSSDPAAVGAPGKE